MTVLGPLLATWRAKAAIGRASFGRAARESRLRVLGLGTVGLVVMGLTFGLFRRAFAFLHALDVVGPVLVVRLLTLFFFVLFAMLVMSNLLVTFQTFFRSREADFWMVAPLPARRVFDARAPEVAAMASWAFLCLGTALLLAFGAGTGARPAFYAVLGPVLVLFVVVAHALGALVALAVVRVFPGLDMKRLLGLLVIAAVPVGAALLRAFRVGGVRRDADVAEMLVHALEGLGRTQYPWLPGYWTGEALRAAAVGNLPRAAFFAWSLLVTAAFLVQLARLAAGRWLVPGFQALRGAGLSKPLLSRTRRRRLDVSGGPRLALAWKDRTVFVRDPAQWTQVGLVALLGAVYVVNLRHLPGLRGFALWGEVASYLNVGVVLLLVATLATRFAFPLISLEGRRAWVVMLAPFPRESLVLQKLLVAWPPCLVFGVAASLFSTRTLGVAPSVALVSHGVAALASFSLAGLSVGLGALFPNFREDNPARIVSGFGGTLNFLLGLTHAGACTLLLGAPSVLQALGRIEPAGRVVGERLALGLVVVLSLAVGVLPLWAARRRLRTLEL